MYHLYPGIARLSMQEALPHNRSAVRPPQVEYSVVLSPVYRVPVLYFSLRDVPAGSNASVENVQDLIVPPRFVAQIRSVGVMGGISMTVSINRGIMKGAGGQG